MAEFALVDEVADVDPGSIDTPAVKTRFFKFPRFTAKAKSDGTPGWYYADFQLVLKFSVLPGGATRATFEASSKADSLGRFTLSAWPMHVELKDGDQTLRTVVMGNYSVGKQTPDLTFSGIIAEHCIGVVTELTLDEFRLINRARLKSEGWAETN